jgi:NTP pyrophosphatase (non-canonical NTP hydrolase)
MVHFLWQLCFCAIKPIKSQTVDCLCMGNLVCLNDKSFVMEKYKQVIDELIKFRNDREWEQFHDSKNLALAIALEAAELNELFLWKKGDDVENIKIDRLKEELADILSFSFLLAEKHNLDVFEIILEKIKSNNEKYPVDKAKGTAKKYNEL